MGKYFAGAMLTYFELSSDILKMDIEGAEYASLTRLSRDFPAASGREYPIGQVMIEVHIFAAQNMSSGEFLRW
jgi:hypothetical protein